ncbi:MAG: hypothetical protein K0Q95_1667 [Bacteroidota bacterium]|jgi:hypothetical protein|nr:hypothetical protein [Bacteroidota bacterium]
MTKYKLIPLLLIITLGLSAQESSQFIHKHLMRADASVVAGTMYMHNLSNVYLNGNLEYYLDNTISIRGDANYLLGSSGTTEDLMHLKDNISVMLGLAYHFKTNNHLDPYFIFQPGVAYVSSYSSISLAPSSDKDLNTRNYKGSLSPLSSFGFGANYYFQRFAHLFVEGRYVHGRHLSQAPSPIFLNELRITFGLGFNMFVMKEKKRPV